MSVPINLSQSLCQDFDWIAPVTEWIRNLAIIIGVAVAWRQLGQWRLEKVALKRSELGEELVAVSNEISEKIKGIRSPFGYGAPEGEADDGTFDYFRRLQELSELDDEFAKLSQLKIRARGWLDDDDLSRSIDAFFEARSRLIVGLNGMIRQVRGESRYGTKYFDSDRSNRIAKYEAVIWEDYADDDDPISSLVVPALEMVEKKMFPLIRLEHRSRIS